MSPLESFLRKPDYIILKLEIIIKMKNQGILLKVL